MGTEWTKIKTDVMTLDRDRGGGTSGKGTINFFLRLLWKLCNDCTTLILLK